MNQVLIELLRAGTSLSGENIGESLGISRAAVWKQINKIKERGISVESIHGKGYQLGSLPGKGIFPEALYLKTEALDLKIHHRTVLESTNDRAKEIAAQGTASDFLVVCDEQTKGKGRRGRSWLSNRGDDLTFTLGLRLDEPLNHFFRYTMMMSLAIHSALKAYAAQVSIKWPNDILVDDKKICGILSEMLSEGRYITHILMGAGVNINSRAPLDTATTLKTVTGSTHDLTSVLADIIQQFYHLYSRYRQGEYESIFAEWKEAVAWKGKEVRIIEAEEEKTGTLKDINPDGSLILDTGEGEIMIWSGDLEKSLRKK